LEGKEKKKMTLW